MASLSNISFTINIQGGADLTRILDQLVDAVTVEIPLEIEASAVEMNDDIANNIHALPFKGASGELLQSNVLVPIEGGFNVAVTAKHAPYVEFGTGKRVQVPNDPDIQALAAAARNQPKGNFQQFIEALTRWAKRAGLPDQSPSTIWLIAMAILHNGLPARPFFYPAYYKQKTELPKRIQAVIDNASK